MHNGSTFEPINLEKLQLHNCGTVDEFAKKLYGGAPLVVVAGDADAIASDLARFGEVTVVDPEKEMKTMRTLKESPR